MRCHYEVLGVPLDVDSSTLRAAYKKCALKWHPDKNLDDVDKAKEEFQLVQQAFEVLSDPHERAWYDKYRETILKEVSGFGDDCKNDGLNLFPFFSASCYKGYGDDEKGFYAVYREIFNKIMAEDMDFSSNEDDDDSQIPDFGQSNSSFEEVVHPFYAYWENYCTTKTFVWLDECYMRKAPSRREMKFIEKENKKARDKARKERNELIRNLVSFVKKRDKRLAEHRKHLKERAVENAKKMQLNRIWQLEERKREIAESKEAEWSKMENIERELKEIEANLAREFGENTSEEDNGLEDEDGIVFDHLYCVACKKTFKNDKSFANHEKSKKHKQNIVALKLDVESDDIISDLDEVELGFSHTDLPQDIDNIDEEKNEFQSSKADIKRKKVLKPMEEFISPLASGNSSDNESDNGFPQSSSRKQKRKNFRQETSNPDASNKFMEADETEINSVDERGRKQDQDFMNSRKRIDKKPKGKKSFGKLSKTSSEDTKELNHTCALCRSTFPSKNKLFQHLKTSGHSVYLPKTNT